MKIKNKKTIIIIGSIVLALILCGILVIVFKDKIFKKDSPKQSGTSAPTETKTVKIVDVESQSRPFAVMINNLNEARQVQSGLSEAYIVYELIVEGGITRYLALFKDASTETVGSVRSARHYYLDYVMENDAYFVHWGYSEQAKEDIRTLGINNINGLTYEGVYFYRNNPLGLSTEHTGFTNMELLNKAVNNLKFRKESNKGLLLNYSAESIKLDSYGETKPATNVTIVYSDYITNKYDYDESTKLYNRVVNGQKNVDYAANSQIKVKNIIVYEVDNYTIAGDTKGRQELNNLGTGKGKFISEGNAIDITWEKKDRASQTKYYFKDGTELIVNDGLTFIQIMPSSGLLEIQ